MKRGIFVCGLLVAVVLSAAGLAGGAPGSISRPAVSSWTSNYFVSPTHNIHCRWWPTNALLACTTQDDDFMTAVTVWGSPWYRRYTGGYYFPSGPYLYYGQYWTGYAASNGRAVVRCWSRTEGMTCRSLMTNRGFFISRENYRLYN